MGRILKKLVGEISMPLTILEGKAIADRVFSVASGLVLKYYEGKRKMHADRRDQVADYFLNISKVLDQAADDIEHMGHPSGSCSSLQIFAQRLPNTISDFVPINEAKIYGERLMAAYNLEHVADNLTTKDERDAVVGELRGASGIFLALGYDIKAQR